MNEKDINKLRMKFILASMISIFIVLVFIGTSINLVSYFFVTNSIRKTLFDISQRNEPAVSDGESASPNLSGIFSPEYNYNRYYSFTYDEEGNLVSEKSSGADGDKEELSEYSRILLKKSGKYGRHGNYFYLKSATDDGVKIVFLDCSIEVSAIFRMIILTVGISLLALIITFLLVYRFSEKAVEPEIENNRRQKEFITNASHELKTPLAVIRANTELLEITSGENEWTKSTLEQVERVDGLIKNLVMIAKSQEMEERLDEDADISKAVQETADVYKTVATQANKTLSTEIEPEIVKNIDQSKVRQLATILIDNAIKYCDENGEIIVKLSREKKNAVALSVTNSYEEGKNVDYEKFFERFYRKDDSRNIDRGGYGIGLSIAESICKRYDGSIKASWKDGKISFVCILK